MTDSESRSIFTPEDAALDITFLVMTGASLMTVASAIDPLRAANRVEERTIFRWRIVSPDGTAALTSCGMPIASEPFDPDRRCDLFLVVAGFGGRHAGERMLTAHIRRASSVARATGGIEAGAWLLARAGLLDGRRATTHWEDFEDFAAAFPSVDVVPDRYAIDGRFITTGGASPTFDFMLHLIRGRHGMATALDVASVFIYEQARTGDTAQPLVSLGRPGEHEPRVAAAIRLMEATIDAPMTVAAIARRTGVTTRTLEKLFLQTIGETPGAYFLRLRLSAARRLVKDSREPLADIAARTGFSSTATFSRAFRNAFGLRPSQLRAG